jgi:predicted dehydrogenase
MTRVELMGLVSELGVPLCTVEKPIAVNVRDWRALTELEKTSKTKFAVCHQFRWQRHLVQCQQAVAAGELGAMRFLDISAGMNITGQGTHTLNYGRSIVGDARVTRVFGSIHGWDKHDMTHPAPTASEASLTFDNGVRGLWTSGPISPRFGDSKTVWQHVHVSAYGDTGRVEWQEFGRWEVVGSGGARGGTCEDDGGWAENNLLAQAGFHKAMFAWGDDETARPGTNLADSLHECAVVLALYQSAVERRYVDLADFDPPHDLVERAMALA